MKAHPSDPFVGRAREHAEFERALDRKLDAPNRLEAATIAHRLSPREAH